MICDNGRSERQRDENGQSEQIKVETKERKYRVGSTDIIKLTVQRL